MGQIRMGWNPGWAGWTGMPDGPDGVSMGQIRMESGWAGMPDGPYRMDPGWFPTALESHLEILRSKIDAIVSTIRV